MEYSYEKCNAAIIELNKFDESELFLGEPITDTRLEIFERDYEIALPHDFKYMLSKHNGFSVSSTEVYGLDEKFRAVSLDKICYSEYYEVGNPMPKTFVPFSADGSVITIVSMYQE